MEIMFLWKACWFLMDLQLNTVKRETFWVPYLNSGRVALCQLEANGASCSPSLLSLFFPDSSDSSSLTLGLPNKVQQLAFSYLWDPTFTVIGTEVYWGNPTMNLIKYLWSFSHSVNDLHFLPVCLTFPFIATLSIACNNTKCPSLCL